MSDDLHTLTIAAAAERIAARRLSPVELTDALLDRIERVDPQVRAYVHVDAEGARRRAREAEAEIAAGDRRGPLHGIPVALKDIYDTADMPTTCHSHVFAERRPDADAETTARLRAAGAVILGKLATHEFAFGGPSWDTPFPPARNPWNREHFTGGSSSGSGAAMAAGLALGTLGSDTAGSIRMPAHFCGVAGLKPTYGLVSRRGVSPLAYSLDHCGPLTWTTRDAALMLDAIAGHDPADPASAASDPAAFTAELDGNVRGLRIGVIRHFYERDLAAGADMVAAMEAAIATLAELGAEIETVELSPLQDYHACNFVIMLGEAVAVHEADLQATPERYGEIMRDRLYAGALFSAVDYVQATRLRRVLVEEMAHAFERFDVLITAGGAGPAPKLDAMSKFYVFEKPLITSPFDVAGNPALGVRAGFSRDGLPLGLQIAGRPFADATVLRVGDAFERATPWPEHRPAL